jgi:CBS-domain-containing membrane protein
VKEGISLGEAKELLHRHRIEKLPTVDDHRRLKGLITFKDISLKGKFPNATRDENGQLLCAAMGYTGAKDIREPWERAKLSVVTPAGAEEIKTHDILLPTESAEKQRTKYQR